MDFHPGNGLLPNCAGGSGRAAPAVEGTRQTIGNGGTQSQRLRRVFARTLDRLHGKPREIVGRKTRG